MSAEEKSTFSFPLPESKTVEVYVVRLDDGTFVTRPAEALVRISGGKRG